VDINTVSVSEVCVSELLNRFRLSALLVFLALVTQPGTAQTPGWFHAGTGLGEVNKPRVAIADFAARADSAKGHSALFTQVVRDDLQFSGILELASPSFYPPQAPGVPA
jgi:hypothetical protein